MNIRFLSLRLLSSWFFQAFAVIFLFFLSFKASAQIFPIQSTPQLIPPYSVNLPDYALNDKLRLVLLQRDLSQPSYNLRLRMKIELNGKVIMQTTQGYNPPPIQVSPGLPLIVTGPELLPYLDARNMDFIGYSRDQYLKSKSLPEGAFTISFTAYDFYRPTVQVSNEGSVFAYLMKAEPPMINLPFCGTVIPNQLGGSIMFQWLPRNTSSPNSAMNTEYVFELFEIRPKGANPNAVVQQLRPVFTHRQSNSTFIYGPAEPLLLDSMQYAWRVQAVDLSGTDLFRNRGYSEVCTFTYGGVPPGTSRLTRISNVQAEGLTTRMGKVSWTACENYEGCKVSYRKPGKENVWFEQETADSTVRIQKLEPSTDYEVRVQGRKGSIFGPSSETVNFRTKDQVDYTCGDGSTDVEAIRLRLEQAYKVPLSFAPAGTIVQVGAFEMTITAAQNLGGGHFSGEGTVPLAFLGGMNYQVTFDDLLINEDLIGLDGDLDFVSAMDGYFAQQEIPRLPDGLFLKLYEHLEKIWANRDKPRKYEQEVASALEEFKKEMAGITDSVALGKAKEVYGQMEGLKDGASNPEILKEKVIEIVQANPVQEDFSDPYYPKGEHAGMSSPVQETEVYKMALQEPTNLQPGWYFHNAAVGWRASKLLPSAPYSELYINELGYFNNNQVVAITKAKKDYAQQVKDAADFVRKLEGVQELQKQQNPFYQLSQLSGLSMIPTVIDNVHYKEYGWATFNAIIALTGFAELKGLGVTGKVFKRLDDLMDLPVGIKNVALEGSVVGSLYQGFDHVASKWSKFFPMIEFYEQSTKTGAKLCVITAKTDDLKYANDAIDALAKAKGTGAIAGGGVEISISAVRLDLAVKATDRAGLAVDLNRLRQSAEAKGINVNVLELVEESGKVVARGEGTVIAEKGFSSFAAFKREMGAAGPGMAWHHIVEQNPANIFKFGNQVIHNTDNLIRLPHGTGSIHAKISGYYSSKPLFTNGKTVREWISTRSYQEQYDYGIEMLKQFGWTGK